MIDYRVNSEHLDGVEYVNYQASNRLLIIANEGDIAADVTELAETFRISYLLQPGTKWVIQQALLGQGVEILSVPSDHAVQGYLGNFTLPGLAGYIFDQVLDLQEQPSIASSIAPLGYYHINSTDDDLADVLAKLPDLIGEFDKPKFFFQLPQKCAHMQRGIEGCRQCIDICATDAITSENGKIMVNSYLCQGCGDCATVCPAGAINYQYPDRATTLANIRKLFADGPAILLLHTGAEENIFSFPAEPVIILAVEALGSTGMDIWLGALAYGAQQVWLFDDHKLTAETRQVLSSQIHQANTIVTGLGYADNLIQLADLKNFSDVINRPDIRPAVFQADEDKRTMIRMAVEYLAQQIESTADFCALPEPASFGNIVINPEGCTLCMSCVSVCPEQALAAGIDKPQLKFIEAQCVQCGICSQACPEQVISLQPRYLYDSIAARKSLLLHEATPFHCIQCGKPFATQSMITTIIEKLQDHPIFQGEKQRQLMMCDQCKLTTMFVDRQ